MKDDLFLANAGNGKGKNATVLCSLVRASGTGQQAAFMLLQKYYLALGSRFLEGVSPARSECLRCVRIGLGFAGPPPSKRELGEVW
jgi:ATP:corrinoid adenosyltransferase